MCFTCRLTPYFDLIVLWYPTCYLVGPFLGIQNIKMIILACPYRYCTSQLFEICKQKQNPSILETLIGWRNYSYT